MIPPKFVVKFSPQIPFTLSGAEMGEKSHPEMDFFQKAAFCSCCSLQFFTLNDILIDKTSSLRYNTDSDSFRSSNALSAIGNTEKEES